MHGIVIISVPNGVAEHTVCQPKREAVDNPISISCDCMWAYSCVPAEPATFLTVPYWHEYRLLKLHVCAVPACSQVRSTTRLPPAGPAVTLLADDGLHSIPEGGRRFYSVLVKLEERIFELPIIKAWFEQGIKRVSKGSGLLAHLLPVLAPFETSFTAFFIKFARLCLSLHFILQKLTTYPSSLSFCSIS